MAVKRANSSILSLGDHLDKANDTFYVLLDEALVADRDGKRGPFRSSKNATSLESVVSSYRLSLGIGKGVFWKGIFSKSPVSRHSREFRDSRDSREPQDCGKQMRA